jgi:hypothetical protein
LVYLPIHFSIISNDGVQAFKISIHADASSTWA